MTESSPGDHLVPTLTSDGYVSWGCVDANGHPRA